MQYHPQERRGFVIDLELADTMGLLNEFVIWEDTGDDEIFCVAFEEKYGIYPDKLESFQPNRLEDILNLNGFEWDKTYVLFEEYQNNTIDWEKMVDFLEDEDVNLDYGSWAELA